MLLGANNWLKNWLLQILRQPLCGDKGKVRDSGRAWSELPLAIDCQATNFYILAVYLKTWWEP